MTELSTDAAIADLAERVLDTSLPKSEWTHEAHFALALWCLRHRPDLTKPESMRGVITRLNDAHGTPNTDTEGYHHTITIASMRAASAVHDSGTADMELRRVLARLIDGVFGRSDWIFAYWTPELLFSVDARSRWVEPDIRPLPF